MSRQDTRQTLTPFGARIREAQDASGLTNKAIADEVGVTERLFQKWKQGTVMPTMANLSKLARVLDKSVAWFFEEAAA